MTNDEWPYGCAISAIKCENLDALVDFTKSIITAHTDYLNNPNITDIQKYDQRSLCRYYDLNGFIKSVASEEEYLQWKSLLEECAPAASKSHHQSVILHTLAGNLKLTLLNIVESLLISCNRKTVMLL